MKKLFVFCSSILIALSISAQKATVKSKARKANPANSFCNTLSKIVAQAPDQFEKLKTGEYSPSVVDYSTGEWLGEGWIASIDLPGAIGSYIQPDLSQPNVYCAFFGTFQTETEAKKKFDILKKQLTGCLPNFTVENHVYMINSFQGYPEGLYFIEKKTNNTPPQGIELFILQDTSHYSVHLSVRATTGKPAKYDFCDMLKKIVFSAGSNFLNNCNFIKKEDIYNERGLYTIEGYKTDLILPGTLYCLIDFERDWRSNSKVFNSTTDPAHYFSRIEGFTTETTARKRIEQIKNELITCLLNYQVEKTSPNYYYYYVSYLSEIPLHYVFTQKKQTNQSAPKLILQVEKHNSDFFTINLIVPGTGKLTIPRKTETAVQPKETTQPKLGKQLLELLDYSKDGFKAIKGEKIVDRSSKELKEQLSNFYFDKKNYSKFKTSFLPEGATKSEVRYYPEDESTKFIATYHYYLYPDGVFKGLFDKMKKELGDGFAYEAHERDISRMGYDDDVQKSIFYRKGAKQPQIELILNMDDDTITNGMPRGVLIVVKALKNQSNVADNKPATKDITGNETILKIWQNDDSQGAQTKIAQQLLELLDYAKDRFKTIKGEPNEAMNVKNKYSGAMYFKTSIALKEAVENYIEETNSTIKFKADFGKNLTEKGGKELFKDLSKRIKEGAWDDFEIKEYSGYIFGDYLRVRRKNDYTHTILLTFDDGEHDDSSPKVYITVE